MERFNVFKDNSKTYVWKYLIRKIGDGEKERVLMHSQKCFFLKKTIAVEEIHWSECFNT